MGTLYTHKLDEPKVFYLDELKENNYNENTITNTRNVLMKVRDFEIRVIKDKKQVQSFTYDELVALLTFFNSCSLDNLVTIANTIKRYLSFCRIHGVTKNTIDFTRILDIETLKGCVNPLKSENRYVTKDQLLDIVGEFANPCDRALYLLLFSGVKGKKYSEIINLTFGDIKENTLEIRDLNNNKVVREIELSEELKGILSETIKSSVYYRENGKEEGEVDNLIYSEYVFRPSERYLNLKRVKEEIEAGEYNPLQIHDKVLTNRMHILAKQYSNAKYLTATTLIRSGIIHRYLSATLTSADAFVEKKSFVEWCMNQEGLSQGMGYKLWNETESFIEEYNYKSLA